MNYHVGILLDSEHTQGARWFERVKGRLDLVRMCVF